MKRLIGASLALISCVVLAQSMGDDYTTRFLNYEPYILPKKVEPPKPATPSAKSTEAPKGEQPVDFEWLHANMEKLLQRAITNPTPENASALMYTFRISLDKSQRLMDAVREVNRTDPALNENNRIPYASLGSMTVRRADAKAQETAMRELSAQGGLIIFVDGSCRFCQIQMPIMDMLRNNYGTEYIVISLDGRVPDNYKGPFQRDNGLWAKLKLKLTPSIVYVPRPKGYQGVDPNKYLIVSQGFYAATELVTQIAHAGFHSNLLTASTRQNLDVWNRGVASVEDLNNLRLDPDHPETFKDKIQPILLKQYY